LASLITVFIKLTREQFPGCAYAVTFPRDAQRMSKNKSLIFVAIAIGVAVIVFIAFSERGTDLLPASTLAYASCFLLTIFFLRKRMSSIFDIILTSAASTFSGVWLYEVAYHYYWGTSLGALKYDFSNLSIVLYPGWAFPIYFAIALILFPFLKREYMTLNKPLIATLGLSIILFALWAYLGYPQYYGTSNPTALGYWMNSVTKILSVLPALLFCDYGTISLRKNGRPRGQVQRESAPLVSKAQV
jgi:hypothetical protein